uniref:CDC42 small effector 1 n=1 Tax=Gallus gallus TaxID=9031 RepID=A0A8V1A9P0_CHICK
MGSIAPRMARLRSPCCDPRRDGGGASPAPQVPPPARPHGLRAHGGLCSSAAPAPPGGKLEGTANMSDFWHKLGCCVVEKPQPKKRRRRIDRSMIGEPMNFVHLTHIGSGDMAAGEGLPMLKTSPLASPVAARLLPQEGGTLRFRIQAHVYIV